MLELKDKDNERVAMKKTKIAFGDIKAGDLIEASFTAHGVRISSTGTAFEAVKTTQGDLMWQTSQGGLITVEDDGDDIFRVEVVEVTFDDIQKGDRIRVTVESPEGRKEIVEDTVQSRVDGMNSFWVNSGPDVVVFKRFYDGDGSKRTIEILERGE